MARRKRTPGLTAGPTAGSGLSGKRQDRPRQGTDADLPFSLLGLAYWVEEERFERTSSHADRLLTAPCRSARSSHLSKRQLVRYQVPKSKKPNRGCATRMVGGPAWLFAILRFRCGLGSGFFRSDCAASGDGNCASASRTRAFAELSAAARLASACAIGAGTMV